MENLIFPLSRKEAEKSGKPYDSKVNKNAVFPTRLRELRAQKAITQEKLAEEIGVTKSTISLYEQGDNVPDIKTLVKLADYYGVSCGYLLGKSDSKLKEDVKIGGETGLSDEAIELLTNINYSIGELAAHGASQGTIDLFKFHQKLINSILSYKHFTTIAGSIFTYIKAVNESKTQCYTKMGKTIVEHDSLIEEATTTEDKLSYLIEKKFLLDSDFNLSLVGVKYGKWQLTEAISNYISQIVEAEHRSDNSGEV